MCKKWTRSYLGWKYFLKPGTFDLTKQSILVGKCSNSLFFGWHGDLDGSSFAKKEHAR